MSTHLKGRYEELVKEKNTRTNIWGFIGVGILIVSVFAVTCGVGGLLPVIGMMASLPFVMVAATLGPTPEEEALAESEKQKRIAEQILFDDSVRKIHRDHKLGQIAQGLVQRTVSTIHMVPVVDPEIANVQRQYELQTLQGREQSKQLAYEIKMIAERIRTLKHLERDGLGVMEDLVEAKIINAEEAAMFKELIKDKVMEGIHVDRRGGRSRHHS